MGHGAAPRTGQPSEALTDEALVERVWEGDDEATLILLDRYRRYVRARARQYFMAGGEHDDLVQEGMIGLYKAIRDFDPGHGHRFVVFADVCVTRQILTAVRAATRHKHRPLNSAVPLPGQSDSDDGPSWTDRLASDSIDPAVMVAGTVEREALEEFCRRELTELENMVLQRYVAGETYEEIALAIGRATRSVDNALQRIKRKIEAFLRTRPNSAPIASRQRRQ